MLWKAYDEFPFQDAVCYPYWNNAELVQCEPAGVYATAYERAQDGLLMFVSNLSEQEVDARVTLRQSLHTAWVIVQRSMPCRVKRWQPHHSRSS